MSRFIQANRDGPYLFPPSVQEWLPENHLARFVVEVIERLDLGALTRVYAGRGSAAHYPAVLLGLLVYGYATKVASSRKTDRADVPDGMDVPAEIARREDRLTAIAQAKVMIKQCAQERHALEQEAYGAKQACREVQRQAGKKSRGKEPPAAGRSARQGSGQSHRRSIAHHAGVRRWLRAVLQRPSRGRYRDDAGARPASQSSPERRA